MEKRNTRRKSRRDEDEVIDTFSQLSLSRVNGEINKMNKNDMIKLLKKNALNSKGVKEVLSRRLKNYYRKQRMKDESIGTQCFKHLIVIDFEATCESGRNPDYLHEIIEFPAILVKAETGEIIGQFHSYCQPTLNPMLSEFCISLTGISQVDVDKAPRFGEVLEKFENWMNDQNLLTERKSCAFVSDGPWDFCRFLNIQCCLSEIPYPKWARKWINLKKIYGNFYKINKPKIEEMLSCLGLQFEGRLHCGLDDARNLSRIVTKLIQDGCVLQINERLNNGKLEPISESERQRLKNGIATSTPFSSIEQSTEAGLETGSNGDCPVGESIKDESINKEETLTIKCDSDSGLSNKLSLCAI